MATNKAFEAGDTISPTILSTNNDTNVQSSNNQNERQQRHIEVISPSVLDENTLLSGSNGIHTYFSDEKVLIPEIEKVIKLLLSVCEFNMCLTFDLFFFFIGRF